jgi:hypothetical protein
MYLFLKKHPRFVRPFILLIAPVWPLLVAYVILKEEKYCHNVKHGYREMLAGFKQGKV